MSHLPRKFVDYNRSDPVWLDALPGLIERLAARWSLTVASHFPGLSVNYVAPATCADGTPCVLKVSRFVDETPNEIAALRLWNGQGVARLLNADPDQGALLVERLEPGALLVEVAEADDDAATMIAVGILRLLWRPLPGQVDLRPLASWCDAFDRNREKIAQGESGFPVALFQRADALRNELLTTTETPTALHGDMHHYNVLRAQRAPWLAIDPKGLAGDRCFDVCQFFRNPWDVPRQVNSRRLDVFCSELGLDRARTKAWCLVHAVLAACWHFEDGNPWQRAVAYAEETLFY